MPSSKPRTGDRMPPGEAARVPRPRYSSPAPAASSPRTCSRQPCATRVPSRRRLLFLSLALPLCVVSTLAERVGVTQVLCPSTTDGNLARVPRTCPALARRLPPQSNEGTEHDRWLLTMLGKVAADAGTRRLSATLSELLSPVLLLCPCLSCSLLQSCQGCCLCW